MGRLTQSFRQLYKETISELKMELQAALVDLGHKSAFDLLLKEAWGPEQAAMGNSTLPTLCETVLGCVGFSRSLYGASPIRKNGGLRKNACKT
jgi:hypothetical protein